MPLIHQDWINSVFYIYESQEDAERGEPTGGTGFIVVAEAPHPSNAAAEVVFGYAVTNLHCLKKDQPRFCRFNLTAGGFDIKRFEDKDWSRHLDFDDVVVAPLALESTVKFSFIRASMFFTDEVRGLYGIGVGDPTFMVGRFNKHEGRTQNLPAARAGHIAMMNIEPIKRDDDLNQESYLVEMLSLPGYSGSPVFVYVAPDSYRAGDPVLRGTHGAQGPWLLGIDWCHLRTKEPVRELNGHPCEPRMYVEMNTGMAGVVPASKIMDILVLPELVQKRKEIMEEIAKVNPSVQH